MPRIVASPRTLQRINLAGDVAILAGASVVAALDGATLHWKVALCMTAIAWAFWVVASGLASQYSPSNGRGPKGDLALTLIVLAAVVVPLTILRQVSHRFAETTELGRFLLLTVPAVLLVRVLTATVAWRARPADSILVVGAGTLGRITQREVDDAGAHRTVIGHLRFEDEQGGARLAAPVIGLAADIETVLRDRVVNEVYVASSSPEHADAVQRVVRSCERFGVPFALPVGRYRFARAVPACKAALRDGYVHYLSVEPKPLQWALKRLIDVLVSCTALVILAPLLMVVAVAVKLTSRGPVFYRQARVGMHGRAFQMLKFRSMGADADGQRAALEAKNERSGPVFKIANDPRVTPLGRWLRKYSVDELPQIVNVLRGDMSLVGPRPALPHEVVRYEGWQRRRLSVRPGLTCVWQVSGRDRISFGSWMLLDMQYIDHWSLWADLRLLFRTVPVVFFGRGAS